MKNLKIFYSKYKFYIVPIFIISLIYIIMFALGITCPIKFALGISCPGCGMTRAIISALKFDFASAFCYHPLWILLPFAIALFIYFKVKKKSKVANFVVIVFGVLMICVYFYRLFFTSSEIVVWDFKSGAIYKFFSKILK